MSELGLLLCCRRLSTMTALDQEIRAFMGRQCLAPEGAMPRRAELVDAGARPAAQLMFQPVCLLAVQHCIHSAGHHYLTCIPYRGRDPTCGTPDCTAGRRDIANAVTRFGGFQRVAEQLRLPWYDTRGRQGPSSDSQDSGILAERPPAGAAAAAATAQRSSEQPSLVGAAVQQAPPAEESPALREAACEVAALMIEQRLDHVPSRAELEALGESRRFQCEVCQQMKRWSIALMARTCDLTLLHHLHPAGQTMLYNKVTRSGGMRRLAKLLGVPFNEPVGRVKGVPTKMKPGDPAVKDFIWV